MIEDPPKTRHDASEVERFNRDLKQTVPSERIRSTIEGTARPSADPTPAEDKEAAAREERRRAQGFRHKAEELRTASESMVWTPAIESYRRLADTYDKLANDADRRADGLSARKPKAG